MKVSMTSPYLHPMIVGRVVCLTLTEKLSRPPKAGRLERRVRNIFSLHQSARLQVAQYQILDFLQIFEN